MNKLQIEFNNTQIVKFDFIDNIIGNAMSSVFKNTLAHGDYTTSNVHGSFSEIENSNNHILKLKELCNKSTDLGVAMPTIPSKLTQASLNRIHESFHVVEEKLMAEAQAFSKSLDLEVRNVLREINNVVHEIEAMDYKSNPGSAYMVFLVGNFRFQERTVLNSELRKRCIYEFTNDSSVKLLCGYATIGKNLLHCVYDNDPELVRSNLLRPQLSLSTETIWAYEPNILTKKEQEEQQRTYELQVKKWIADNNLSAHVGAEDPIHLNSVQPAYASLCKEYKTLNYNDWYQLFKISGIKSVKLCD